MLTILLSVYIMPCTNDDFPPHLAFSNGYALFLMLPYFAYHHVHTVKIAVGEGCMIGYPSQERSRYACHPW